MRDPRQVAVVGVTGYTGLELAGILLRHPAVTSTAFYVRETRGANCIAELFPQFRGWGQAPAPSAFSGLHHFFRKRAPLFLPRLMKFPPNSHPLFSKLACVSLI